MLRYVSRRAISAVPLLLVVSFLVFSLLYLSPSSPEQLLVGDQVVDPGTLAAISKEYGFDRPFIVQYLTWLGNVLRGNLGISIRNHDTVLNVIDARFGVTLELAVMSTILLVVGGFAVGIVCGIFKGTWIDNILSTLVLIGASVSSYVAGILLIAALAVGAGWFPVFGSGNPGWDRLAHLFLPALSLAVGLTASIARILRASMIEALEEEFVLTARARGLPMRVVVGKHALRNAAIPAVTLSGLLLAGLIGGSVLIEYTFGLNGIGSLLVQSVEVKDFAVVQAIALIYTAVFVIGNLVTDVLCAIIDPRVRLGRRATS